MSVRIQDAPTRWTMKQLSSGASRLLLGSRKSRSTGFTRVICNRRNRYAAFLFPQLVIHTKSLGSDISDDRLSF
jgi:hypothetical protein